jgi:hypothetical protein
VVSRRPRPQRRVRGSGCGHAPGADGGAIRRTHAFGVPGSDLALLTGLRDGRMVSQLR